MENIKFNKLLDDKYSLMSDIAKKYNYNDELLSMITFIYVAFYLDFGKEVDFPLYDLFNRVKIIYEEGNVSEIANKYGYGKMNDGCAAVTIFTPNFRVFNNPEAKQNSQVILLGTHVEDYLATPILKLEMLAHEIRHALMGYYNTNKLIDSNTYYMRSGLQETFYKRKDSDNRVTSIARANTLAEITNTYITEIIVNRIMSFSNYDIKNSNLKRYLKSLGTKQPDGRYRAIGYNNEVRLLYPLLLNDMFINLVNQCEFDGNLDLVKNFIETNTDICSYDDFCKILDEVYKENNFFAKYVQEKNMDKINRHVENINKIKSVVMSIKENLDCSVLKKV